MPVPEGSPPIAPVTEENTDIHVARLRQHKLHKAFLKAKDRRINFQDGEVAGFLYAMGLVLVAVGAGSRIYEGTWMRAALVVGGLSALVAKTYMKRRFWKETEDAEYKEELEDVID